MFQALADGRTYPDWWKPVYREVQSPGPPTVGVVSRHHLKGWLPYHLRLESRITRLEPPRLVEAQIEGDLVGRGLWVLAPIEGGGVRVRLDCRVSPARPLLVAPGPLAGPFFRSNHRWVMERAIDGLEPYADPGFARGERLLSVSNLVKYFPVRGGVFARVRQWVKAVDGVSFRIAKGRTLGLVGESGCGKTTVGRTLLRLSPPTAGRVWFQGRPVFSLGGGELRKLRRDMQIIFQDPYGSLNPRMTVGTIVGEPLWIHRLARGRALRREALKLLDQVGLPADAVDRYPHEFSGGQRQRIGVARALALNPKFIVCDEPTSALDVSIRAQVINLLRDLQDAHEISYLFISHDLGVVRHISHEVAVMYLGKIVEQAATETLFRKAAHPYTQVLLAAIPVPDPTRRRPRLTATDDDIPSPIRIPSGCRFHPRCPLYEKKGKPEECRAVAPALRPVGGDPQHLAACHFAEESPMVLGQPLETVAGAAG